MFAEFGMGKRENPDENGAVAVQTPPEPLKGFAEARMTARSRDSSGFNADPLDAEPEG